MPTYVDSWRRRGALAPIACRRARLYGFVLRAEFDALDRLAQRWLREPSDHRLDYRPLRLFPWVFVTFAHIERLQPQDAPYADLGWMDETEVTFWTLFPRRHLFGVVPTRFAFHVPHIFVDRAEAMQQGRELYGFPKQLASFSYPDGDSSFPTGNVEPGRIVVSAFGTKSFSREARWHDYDLMELVPVADVEETSVRSLTPDAAHDTYGSLGMRVHQGLPLGEDLLDETLTLALRTISGLIPPEGRLAFLKQFPGAEGSDEADYQAIVEATIRVDEFHQGGILDGRYLLKIVRSDTHPIVDDLGLEPTESGGSYFAPRLGWWADLSFTLLPGHRVWPPRSAAYSIPAPSTSPTRAPRRKRIAILGGGVGAMTAAYWLTHPRNPAASQLEVTVYQMGARLGGKGASGRDQTTYDRIEEHGLHVWFGFYYNAVAMMRDCFAELEGSEAGGAERFRQSFLDASRIALGDRSGGDWRNLVMAFPNRVNGSLDPAEMAGDLVAWMRRSMAELPVFDRVADLSAKGWRKLRRALGEAFEEFAKRRLDARAHRATGNGGGASRWHMVADVAGDLAFRVDRTLIGRLLGRLRERLGRLAARDERTRRTWMAVDLAIAALRGIFSDDVLRHGFDHLDRETLAEWLRRHGASEETLDSGWIRSMYGIVFAFPEGDTSQGDIGAGTVLRSALRMLFRYRDSFLWKLRAGMGDIVFAPLYEACRKRGVRFQFFHRVRSIEPDADRFRVGTVRLGRQVDLAPGRDVYEPLVTIGGRPCWPKHPRLEQLCDDDARALAHLQSLAEYRDLHILESSWSPWNREMEEEVTLRLGEDFDDVVLGISLGALPEICAPLAAASARWQRMFAEVKTVRTQAFQVWMNRSIEELSRTDGESLEGVVATAYGLPIDSWADLSQVLDAERWPAERRPRSVAYFCGVMKEDPAEPARGTTPAYPETQRRLVVERARRALREQTGVFWPQARAGDDFDWSLLVRTSSSGDDDPLEAQYFTANIDPSERYVLSTKNSVFARLRSEAGTEESRSGFLNLYLAGDWTRNGLNAGFVESAVVSGMQAARAASGWSELEIEGETDFGSLRRRRRRS